MAEDVTPKLSVRELVVRRGGRELLNIPRLDVADGEVLAVIGPNGAGKTTLLLHLALLHAPTMGEVLFEGTPSDGRVLALRRRMAVVFQEPLLLERSVASNVELGMQIRGVPSATRKDRAERWLTRFNVAHLASRSPRMLSGGEAQRVSLARAFALEPDVLLLDEPFSALDQPTRQSITDDLARAMADTGVTTVLVTHDRDEAAQLGTRVAVLLAGRIRQIGPPGEVFGAPVDEETAAFVGIESIVEGRVVERAGGIVTLAVGASLVEAVDDREFEHALICLRPEDISLHEMTEHIAGSARNRVGGRITRVIRSGADARVEVDCGFKLLARVTRRSLEEMGVDEGCEVIASFKATAVHLLPK